MHGSSIHLVEGSGGLPAPSLLFLQDDPLFLQFIDPFFERLNHAGALRLDDTVKQLIDFLPRVGNLFFQVLGTGRLRQGPMIPQAPKHLFSYGDKRLFRRHASQYGFEVLLQHIAADRFTLVNAFPVLAHVIGMPLAGVALRPRRSERVAAFAGYSAPKREIQIEVFAGGRVGAPGQTVLYLAKGLIADHPFMFAFA